MSVPNMNVGDRVRVNSSVVFTPQRDYVWMIGRIVKLLFDGRSAHVKWEGDSPDEFGGAVILTAHLTPAPGPTKTDD